MIEQITILKSKTYYESLEQASFKVVKNEHLDIIFKIK